MKRRFDEKTIGLDFLIHSELKILAKEKNLQMKDLMMTILTDYITTKNKQKKNAKMQESTVWEEHRQAIKKDFL